MIELLIVVVIIGILAAIAIPKFGSTKEKAVVTTMRSDLRNLAGAQETYWRTPRLLQRSDSGRRRTSRTALAGRHGHGGERDAGRLVGQATAPGLTAQTCSIFYGTAPAIPPAKADAAVACT